MGLLLPLALCALALSYSAAFPAQQTAKLGSPFFARGCNDSDVLSFVGFALDDINKDRKDGYIFSLNRVSDAREQRQDDEPGGSLFYLTMDVIETKNHVLSKKPWKECADRNVLETDYGQCKAIFYINRPRRVLYTLAYNCTLRPVTQRSLQVFCPDCPRPARIDGADPKVTEAVTESLAKLNRESNSKQYSLVEVTKASRQLDFGSFYFVEYLIKEVPRPCTKSMDSTCAFQPLESAPVGLCKGSLIESQGKKSVEVTCDFFESQDAATRGAVAIQPLPAKLPKVQDGAVVAVQPLPATLPKVQDAQPKNAEGTEAKRGPRGTVQRLPPLPNEVPQQSQDQNQTPEEDFPVHLDLTTNPEGQALDVSFLFIGPLEEKLLVLPFPSKEQRSVECPGPALKLNHLSLPL